MTDEHWQANLQIAQTVLDKLEREGDPAKRDAYTEALAGVEAELADAKPEEAEA